MRTLKRAGLASLLALVTAAVAAPASADTAELFDVGGPAFAAVFTADGNTVYVTDGGVSVLVVDADTRAVLDTFTVTGSIGGIALSPDESTLWAADGGNDAVYPIDTATGTLGSAITVGDGPFAVALTADGSTLYVSNDDATVSVIDTDTATVTATIPAIALVLSMVFNLDESELWLLSPSESAITIIDTSDNSTRTISPVSGADGYFDVAFFDGGSSDPDGALVSFVDGADSGIAFIEFPDDSTSIGLLPISDTALTSVEVDYDALSIWMVDIEGYFYNFPYGGTTDIEPGAFGFFMRPGGNEIWIGSVYSDYMSILSRPIPTGLPTSPVVSTLGTSHTFTASLPSSTYYGLQWQEWDGDSWEDIDGEESLELTVVHDASNDGHRYRLMIISTAFGFQFSPEIEITQVLAATGVEGVGPMLGGSALLLIAGAAVLVAARRIRAVR